MRKITKRLTRYAIQKGIVDKSDMDVYEYGFTITIEVGLFVLFVLFISIYLNMIIEGILFFIIFAPLRSYAGGLHLDKFHFCFILSCLIFLGILMLVRYIYIPIILSFIIFFILEVSVYILYPVENINREVDDGENQYFKKKLKKFLVLDLIIAVMCIALKNDRYILLVMITFLMVVMTMIIGKYKNSKRSSLVE